MRWCFVLGGETPRPGRLSSTPIGCGLKGRSAEGRVELSVPYAELTEVRIGRAPEERLSGHLTLLVGREHAPPLQIEPLGAGLLHEIADLLAVLATQHADSGEQVAVIVPLKRGQLARVQELVAQGPPFDPAALGLTRHQVFLSAREVTFIFAGEHVRATLEHATSDPTLWQRRARLARLHRRAAPPLDRARAPARRRRSARLLLGRRQQPGMSQFAGPNRSSRRTP